MGRPPLITFALLALAATVLSAPLKSDNLRSSILDVAFDKGAMVGLPILLANLGQDCACHFKGLCTCESSLEFMECISSSCGSGKCDCGDTAHYGWACGNMSATCPTVGLTCDGGKAACMKQDAPRSPAVTVAPQPTAQIVAEPVPTAAPAGPTLTWQEWFTTNQLVLRMITFFVEIIPFLIAAAIYNMYRFKMDFHQIASVKSDAGFTFGLFSCFEDVKITLLSWCCMPLRWADTLDKTERSGQAPIMRYWAAVFTFIILMALNPLSAGICSLILLFLCTYGRQKLRQDNDIKAGGLTIVEDGCTYMWCGCCAVAQEAREVESTR